MILPLADQHLMRESTHHENPLIACRGHRDARVVSETCYHDFIFIRLT